jgi:branched-chain amino acid transport system ATP-binding protein
MKLNIDHIDAGYGRVTVLREVSLVVDENQFVGVLGPNGAGKSTLLKAIMGACSVFDGSVNYGNDQLTRLPEWRRAHLGIGFVPEGRRVWPSLTVRDTLLLGAWPHRKTIRGNEGESLDRVLSVFPRLKERINQSGGMLSGGEQQMLSIGRALMGNPTVLLVDEPSIGLAPKAVEAVMQSLYRLREDAGIAILLVEQKVHHALALCDKALVLNKGRVVFEEEGAKLADVGSLEAAYFGSPSP